MNELTNEKIWFKKPLPRDELAKGQCLSISKGEWYHTVGHIYVKYRHTAFNWWKSGGLTSKCIHRKGSFCNREEFQLSTESWNNCFGKKAFTGSARQWR